MKTITLHFAGNDYVFQYNDDFTVVKLYNDFFKGFFVFAAININCGHTLGKCDIVETIKSKIRNN